MYASPAPLDLSQILAMRDVTYCVTSRAERPQERRCYQGGGARRCHVLRDIAGRGAAGGWWLGERRVVVARATFVPREREWGGAVESSRRSSRGRVRSLLRAAFSDPARAVAVNALVVASAGGGIRRP